MGEDETMISSFAHVCVYVRDFDGFVVASVCARLRSGFLHSFVEVCAPTIERKGKVAKPPFDSSGQADARFLASDGLTLTRQARSETVPCAVLSA